MERKKIQKDKIIEGLKVSQELMEKVGVDLTEQDDPKALIMGLTFKMQSNIINDAIAYIEGQETSKEDNE